jgi:hypothetical protein
MVEYDDNQPCNFSDEVEFKQPEKPTRKEEDMNDVKIDVDVPAKFYMTNDLKKLLPDYQVRRKNIKNKKQQEFWEIEIENLLNLYDSKGDQYHFKLCRCVLQILQNYCIWDNQLGETKKFIALNILSKFFDNNKDLLSAVIEDQLEFIERSNLFKRLCARMEIFFFSKK